MYRYATLVFWLTLILYLTTLFTVSYVGVYLTYIAIPILVLSGLIMKFSTPKDKKGKVIENHTSLINNVANSATTVLDGTNQVLEGVNDFLGDFNSSMEKYNRTNELVRERGKVFSDKIQNLKMEIIPLQVNLKYAKTHAEKSELTVKIKKLEAEIQEHEKYIEQIRHACELEVNAQ